MTNKIDKNKNLIIACFPEAKAAKAAAKKLKQWDNVTKDIKLGGIGVVTLDKKGKIKIHKAGERTTSTGAKWGVALGAAAGILTGGIGLVGGVVAGAAVGAVGGALFHKSLGMEDDDKARLEAHLQNGGAALVVMVDEYEVGPTRAELTDLGGAVEHYAVSEATVAHLEAAHGEDADGEEATLTDHLTTILHYHRPNADYEGWGLHVWTGYNGVVDWENPLSPTASDEFGIIFEVPLAEGTPGLGYILHKGDEKDLQDDQYLNFAENGREVWITQSTQGYVIPAAR